MDVRRQREEKLGHIGSGSKPTRYGANASVGNYLGVYVSRGGRVCLSGDEAVVFVAAPEWFGAALRAPAAQIVDETC